MLDFLKSTVGRKYIMGITGLVWMGFIFGHMAGNLLIFAGADAFNAYGNSIVMNKILIYGTEIVLTLTIILHIFTAVSLTIQNRAARGSSYAVGPHGDKGARFASKTMALQGSIILAFIILHLATFKYGVVYETEVAGVKMRDLHRLVVETFHQPGYVAWYCVALIILMFHLSHGAHSIFQSFGVLERKLQHNLRVFAWIYAIVVVGGFISQPLYVFLIHQ